MITKNWTNIAFNGFRRYVQTIPVAIPERHVLFNRFQFQQPYHRLTAKQTNLAQRGRWISFSGGILLWINYAVVVSPVFFLA